MNLRSRFFLVVCLMISGPVATADFPMQLPQDAAISCVNPIDGIFAFIFLTTPGRYGIDITDMRDVPPLGQYSPAQQMVFYSSLPRLFPRTHVDIDRSQLPQKLIFSYGIDLRMEIDIGNPIPVFDRIKYIGSLRFETDHGLKEYATDCLEGTRGPLTSL